GARAGGCDPGHPRRRRAGLARALRRGTRPHPVHSRADRGRPERAGGLLPLVRATDGRRAQADRDRPAPRRHRRHGLPRGPRELRRGTLGAVVPDRGSDRISRRAAMASVTGLGGVFYKVADPDRTRSWYLDNLGLGGEWGIMFPWPPAGGEDPLSLLTAFEETTDYMAPSTEKFMINLRVDDLDGLVADLEAK